MNTHNPDHQRDMGENLQADGNGFLISHPLDGSTSNTILIFPLPNSNSDRNKQTQYPKYNNQYVLALNTLTIAVFLPMM
jgi:hypothetical protein